MSPSKCLHCGGPAPRPIWVRLSALLSYGVYCSRRCARALRKKERLLKGQEKERSVAQ